MAWPANVQEWHELVEVLKDGVEILAVFGALWVYYTWTRKRRDRATNMLFALERKFARSSIAEGRRLIEEDTAYDSIRAALRATALADRSTHEVADAPRAPHVRSRGARSVDPLDHIDALLRFYVLVVGVRAAGQVNDSALRACFRYWLGHYFNPARRELRLYIDRFFPTLRDWLRKDRSVLRRRLSRSFFTPEMFGWHPEHCPRPADLRPLVRGRVLVITGAGISAESGVPTYRGRGGIWRDMKAELLARRRTFAADPAMVNEWYEERRRHLLRAKPNRGHELLATLERTARDYLLVTQNVDRLHERAGSQDPVHIHGDIFSHRCDPDHVVVRPEIGQEKVSIPPCSVCRRPMRPGVVWFDEDLAASEVTRIERFLEHGECDLVLVIGTSAAFDYVFDWALRARGKGGLLVEINPKETPLSSIADVCLRSSASRALGRLVTGSAVAVTPTAAPSSGRTGDQRIVADGQSAPHRLAKPE